MKHVIFIISLLVLISCKDSEDKDLKTNAGSIETTTLEHSNEEASNLYDNSWKGIIETNNGSKWQANAETNEGIEKMQELVKTHSTSSLKNYYQLASNLNTVKNKVVKECSMKGASHDNLHVWLLPLIDKIEALSEVKTMEDAEKLKHSIEENINAYSAYFK
jgi:hypothetical protein